MTKLTDLQYRLMDLYAHCEMNGPNGATPTQASDVNTYLWVDERAKNLGLSRQACGGVLTSLYNEGLVNMQSPSRGDPDGGFQFTEAGFQAWRAERTARGEADIS